MESSTLPLSPVASSSCCNIEKAGWAGWDCANGRIGGGAAGRGGAGRGRLGGRRWAYGRLGVLSENVFSTGAGGTGAPSRTRTRFSESRRKGPHV